MKIQKKKLSSFRLLVYSVSYLLFTYTSTKLTSNYVTVKENTVGSRTESIRRKEVGVIELLNVKLYEKILE